MISVSMEVADRPICGPKRAGSSQNTDHDMATIGVSGTMTFEMK